MTFSHRFPAWPPSQGVDQWPPVTAPTVVTTAPRAMTRSTFEVVVGETRTFAAHFACHLLVAASASPARLGRMTRTASAAITTGSHDRWTRRCIATSLLSAAAERDHRMIEGPLASVSGPTVLPRTDHGAGPGP